MFLHRSHDVFWFLIFRWLRLWAIIVFLHRALNAFWFGENIVPPPRPLCMYGIQHHYCIGIVCIIAFPERSQSFFALPQKKDSNQNAKKTLFKVKVRLFWRQGLLDWQQNCVKSSIDFLLSESWQVLLQVSRPTWYMLPVPILTIKLEKTIFEKLSG